MKKLLPVICTAALLAACSSPDVRYSVPTTYAGDKIRTSVRSIELREVSLPAYAAADEISVQDETGAIVADGSALWADQPVRAISLELSRALSQITNAQVAAEPWPFESFPQARLDVRIEQLLASTDGTFRASGQYFLAALEGGRDRSGTFDLAIPFDAEAGPPAISAARGEVIAQLARYIAEKAL